jgi:DNA sulfur modification protein DndB
VIIDAFEAEWHAVLAKDDGAAGAVRDEYLFADGLGWQGVAQAAAMLIRTYDSGWEPRFRKAVAQPDWTRSADEWQGNAVICSPATDTCRVNNTGPAVKDLANKILASAG